jgi:hypothetical protein
VIPKNWLEEATAEQPGAGEDVLKEFYAWQALPSIEEIRGYGFHIGRVAIAGLSNPKLAGMGGQYGFVLPELDASIVQTANFTADAGNAPAER